MKRKNNLKEESRAPIRQQRAAKQNTSGDAFTIFINKNAFLLALGRHFECREHLASKIRAASQATALGTFPKSPVIHGRFLAVLFAPSLFAPILLLDREHLGLLSPAGG